MGSSSMKRLVAYPNPLGMSPPLLPVGESRDKRPELGLPIENAFQFLITQKPIYLQLTGTERPSTFVCQPVDRPVDVVIAGNEEELVLGYGEDG